MQSRRAYGQNEASGAVSGSLMPTGRVIVLTRNSTSAGCRGHGASMNVCIAQAAAAIYRVKTISIRKPTVERLRSRTIDFSGGFVRRVKFRPGASPTGTDAAIVNSFSLSLQSHSGIIIRQTIPGSAGSNRQPICRVKAEKPDAASARTPRRCERSTPGRPARQSEETVRADAAHAERDDADPSVAIESIELQTLGNQWANQVSTDRPMKKKKILPTHGHTPRVSMEAAKACGRFLLNNFPSTSIRTDY